MSVAIVVSGQVALPKVATVRSMSPKIPVKSAPVRSAFSSVPSGDSKKILFAKLASIKLAPLKSTPTIKDSLRLAPSRLAPERFAPVKSNLPSSR